jgi:hypothetical protein
MRLAFDLDGTVADMQSALAREARRLFPDINPDALPRSVPPDVDSTTPSDASATEQSPLELGFLSSSQQRELWKAVRDQENWWETLAEIEPGSLARLYQLVRDRKWELMFITSRPETRGDTAQAQSYRWLAARGYETPSIFVVHGSRGKIAAALALDVLVDDRPENCLDVAIDSPARPILVWRGDEGKVPASARQLGIGAVTSVHECLDILESLARPDGEGMGLIDRLKRLLGLKPQAAGLYRPKATGTQALPRPHASSAR